jgi:hypothetical protein
VLDHSTNAIAADPKKWVDFMMRFELGLERPDPKRAPVSALTIAISYVVGFRSFPISSAWSFIGL